jgi:phosphotransferase system HPr (HPr) family protein
VATIEIQVTNPSGLHARPATLFVEAAGRFESRIRIENLDRGSRAVDAKSILMLLTIGVINGQRIRISADGPDADAAVETLRDLVATGLTEATGG